MSGLVGIDWGTTHRRAYRLDADGALVDERSDDQGLLAVAGRCADAFEAVLAGWPGHLPVVMSGMVGAASGWQEVPYVSADVPLADLPRHLVPLRDAPAGRRAWLVPGLRHDGPDGRVEVMRGEETQLLGALALAGGDGCFVFPGTHSKWVQVAGGRVTGWRTYMTGELFALLGRQGTLAALVGDDDHPPAFVDGLRAAADGPLSHTLFGCRARVVAGRMPASHARSWLSGLLIGAEWHDRPAPTAAVVLVASDALAGPHRVAAAQHGVDVRVLAPRDVHLAALRVLSKGVSA